MTSQEFIAKWGPGGPAFHLNEEQGAQSYFLDLCALLGVSKPGSEADYLFEEQGTLVGGRVGYADVFKRKYFAWENKAPGKNLDAALRQLLAYSLALDNPPLLVVCDRLTVRIHTQFNGYPSETHTIALAELDRPEKLTLLRNVWIDPEHFRPRRTNRDITDTAARSFAAVADQMRQRGNDAEQVAHFLTQCLFCFFAEDVGLLPGRMFERLVNNRQITSELLSEGLRGLFAVMRDGGLYGADSIPWFNGGLFVKVDALRLQITDVIELRNAAALNWSAIDVSIFGTLFERGLDPAKRAQLGAHYTDPETIERIIDPVIRRPLLREWNRIAGRIAALMTKSRKRGDKPHRDASRAFIEWLNYLKDFRALDPACGSGNFLYLALKALKDIEHHSHLQAADLGLDRQTDLVTGPHNVLGIELNEYAAELARVTVWIGELQWRLAHGYEFKINPILEPLEHIECRDALMQLDPGGVQAVEAVWPVASVVIGNPPFLGDKKMRSELGDEYTDALRRLFKGRVPGGADLVTYWFEKARAQIESHGLGAAGLVATNSIRQSANRKVLERVCSTARIFDAWSDEPWVNDGAAVRVSLICQGWGDCCFLNGQQVDHINADLTDGTHGLDLTVAKPLPENVEASFFGLSLAGAFVVDGAQAREWLAKGGNPNCRPNSDVLRPIWNGADVTGRAGDRWVIDFALMDEAAASLYELPFEHVLRYVKPVRIGNHRASRARAWWRHGKVRPGMRHALRGHDRFIVTSETSKHRYFAWCPSSVAPEHKLVVIPRSDDQTFGILSSRAHVVWALAVGSSLEDRPVYTTSRCFEPFPFPDGMTPNLLATAHDNQHAAAVAQRAKRLDDLRAAWLNPSEWIERQPEVVPLGMTTSPYPDRMLPRPGFEKHLAERTLTKLYNQRPAWLDDVHKDLDAAVAAAYAWTDYSPAMPDEEILRRLLALNLARSK